jgi:glycerol-3-phosphate dehydrogenase
MGAHDVDVAVIGGGVVGCAVAHALARRGVSTALLEARAQLALEASGANSGILHTGFDSPPAELETQLILRSVALRAELVAELGVEVWRCGARMQPRDDVERSAVARLAQNARANGTHARLSDDGSLEVPGESVTDPVAFTSALAAAAQAGGARIQLQARVCALAAQPGGGVVLGLASGERVAARAAVNCAGLHADEIAAIAGDAGAFEIYPRKGEFLVFAPSTRERLEQILLPVPSGLGKGVLVFPTLHGEVIAGPTALERADKDDFSVEGGASERILARARDMYAPLARAQPIAAYAGLRPAGVASNYVIAPSRALRGLVHAAAIRSTGLSASLGIGEHVALLLEREAGVELGPVRPLPGGRSPQAPRRWWERAPQARGERVDVAP